MTGSPLARFAETARQAVDDGRYQVDDPVEAGPSLADNVAGSRGIVAEIKPASPSRGPLAEDLDPGAVAAAYGLAGAVGVSVLTEPHEFQGSVANLQAASRAGPPTLMKDFVVRTEQIQAAAGAGAGAVLLIRALHDHTDLALEDAIAAAHARDLDVLLEVYDEEGLEAARATEADIVGVNNRDLRDPDLPLDLKRAPRLLGEADLDRPAMALSGMTTADEARAQLEAGADAVLVGTAFMQEEKPAQTLRGWLRSL